MLEMYRANNIQWAIVNTKRDRHTQLAILDRVVRTIRDMRFHTYFDPATNTAEMSPNVPVREMNSLTQVYNKTWHSTLSEAAGEKVTPYDVHVNPVLELKIIRSMRIQNYIKQKQPGFLLEVGQKVLVKNDNPNTFQKKRTPYIPGIWTITGRRGNMYTLENDGKQIIKPRSVIVKR